MELPPIVETVVRDTVLTAKFIGERAVGGAFAKLAEIVHPTTPDNITKGNE